MKEWPGTDKILSQKGKDNMEYELVTDKHGYIMIDSETGVVKVGGKRVFECSASELEDSLLLIIKSMMKNTIKIPLQ